MKFNDVLENLTTYEAGKPIELVVREYGVKPENVVKLASNENPYGTSPKVVAKIQELAKNMFVYPDDYPTITQHFLIFGFVFCCKIHFVFCWNACF